MKEKKKLTEEQQAILIYSGELLLFSIIFIIIGVLKMIKVIDYNDTRRVVFNWITLIGGLWGITDFVWTLVSKKKRVKSSMVDKSLTLFLALSIMVYDLISLIAKPANENFYIYFLGAALIYAGVVFMFMSIYHYFKPLPELLESIEKAKEEEENNETNQEENNTKEKEQN